jgi:hypothetical protein
VDLFTWGLRAVAAVAMTQVAIEFWLIVFANGYRFGGWWVWRLLPMGTGYQRLTRALAWMFSCIAISMLWYVIVGAPRAFGAPGGAPGLAWMLRWSAVVWVPSTFFAVVLITVLRTIRSREP